MKNLGPTLVILFSVLILGAMFVPYARGFDGNASFWVLTSGADVALAVACLLALGCALGALATKVGALRTLAALFGGLACGVIWAFSANVISHTEGTKAGFWILTVLGIMILLAAVISAVSAPSGASAEVAAPSAGTIPRAAAPGPAPAPAAAPAHPAGWYPAPGGGAAERYWDGTRWTDQFRSTGS